MVTVLVLMLVMVFIVLMTILTAIGQIPFKEPANQIFRLTGTTAYDTNALIRQHIHRTVSDASGQHELHTLAGEHGSNSRLASASINRRNLFRFRDFSVVGDGINRKILTLTKMALQMSI